MDDDKDRLRSEALCAFKECHKKLDQTESNFNPSRRNDDMARTYLTGKMFQGMTFRENEYATGARAIELVNDDDGSPYARLTVNIPGTQLAEDEILVNVWGRTPGIP